MSIYDKQMRHKLDLEISKSILNCIDKSSIDTYKKFLFISVKRLFELLCHLKILIISWTIFHLQLTVVIKFPVL